MGFCQLNGAFLLPADPPSRPFCTLLNQTRSPMFQSAAIPGNGIPFLDFQKIGGASPSLSGRFGNRVRDSAAGRALCAASDGRQSSRPVLFLRQRKRVGKGREGGRRARTARERSGRSHPARMTKIAFDEISSCWIINIQHRRRSSVELQATCQTDRPTDR